MRANLKRQGPAVQIRPNGPVIPKLKFTPGVPGPASEWRVNELSARFEYRPKGSTLPWAEAPGSDFEGLIGGLTTQQLLFNQALSGSTNRSLLSKTRDTVSVKDFGAKGDGTIGDGAKFVTAINALLEQGGGTLYMPRGIYNLKDLTAKLPLGSNLTFVGDGMDQTKLLYDDTVTQLFVSDGLDLYEHLEFQDFSVVGTWETNQSDGGLHPFIINRTRYIRFVRIGVEYARTIALAVRSAEYASVEGCRIRWCARDGISIGTCRFVRIVGNDCEHIGDDAIAFHGATTDGIDYLTLPTVPRDGIVISSNRITGCNGGISGLSARTTTIIGNVIQRCTFHGIAIHCLTGGNSPEGRATPHSVTITGNTISDMMDRTYIDALNGGADYIMVMMPGVQGNLAAIPGENDVATSSIVSLPQNLYNNFTSGTDTLTARPAGRWLTISGNTLVRTLKNTAKYSDYGFGLYFNPHGWVDPSMNTNILRGIGIRFIGAAKQVIVSDNGIHGIHNGVVFAGGSSLPHAPLKFDDITFSDNQFTDFNGAIVFDANVVSGQRIDIDGNLFDGDPYYQHSNRGTGGTWLLDANPTALDVGNSGGVSGVTFVRNRVRNVGRISQALNSAGDDRVFFHENLADCDPVGLGFSTSNRGIGAVQRSGCKVLYRIVDANPGSATFGEVKNTCFTDRNAMPSTGTYVSGHFVRNNSPAVTAGKVLLGWHRITTGGSHVSGTDWAPVYATTT